MSDKPKPSEEKNDPLHIFNPYRGLNCDNGGARVTFFVSRDDKNHIKLCRPLHGTETTICTILYKKFVEALKAHNILDITKQDELVRFVINMNIVSDFGKPSKAHEPAPTIPTTPAGTIPTTTVPATRPKSRSTTRKSR